jgi:pimeloyl-ACP methyl ester carboxylesterase
VPENWSGTLLVYVHGLYESADPPMVAPPNISEAALLSRGFALAASQFRASGLAIKEGMQDTHALTTYFRGRVGLPYRTVVWGRSMGGLITLGLVEKFPGIYDAGVALCPNAAGTALRWDRGLDFAVAYAAAFGWPAEWGTVGDVRDDLDWYGDVMPLVMSTLAPANRPLWEFVRLVNRLPIEGFYVPAAPDPVPYRLAQVLFATVTRGQYEARAGGPPTQNLDHTYTLSPAEKTYLAGLGLDADPLLAQMNGMKFAAERPARNYADHYLTPEGNSPRPVLTIHTITDSVVTTDHESVLKARYEAARNSQNLFQAFTTATLTPGGPTYCTHCAFTPAQTLTALDAMTAWLDTGTQPSAASFPGALGFDQSYVPPPWPWQY